MSNNSEKKLATSPDRHSFSVKPYQEKLVEDPTDAEAQKMIDFYLDMIRDEEKKFDDIKKQKNDLEFDLRSSPVICQKARSSERYAQNLYSALCNNDFQKLDVLPILKQETWGCSWRYAGGIVAHIVEKGDYIDWYCSGIRGGAMLDVEVDENYIVPEGLITSEIRQDLKDLGWVPAPGGDWEKYE